MKSTKIDRREALVRLGATAVPLVAGFHPFVPFQEGGYRPRLLDGAELDTVAELAERIIPETDTPGAKSALVHQYVDYVVSERDAAERERFREGLRGLDERCRSSFGRRFAELETSAQDELVGGYLAHPSSEEAREVAFFQDLKQLCIEGYYRSEPGMKQELGFEGNAFVTEFEGCTHPEHRQWKPGV